MSNEELIAEARKYTACECRFEGVQMRGCGEHGDDESKLIADLADALEAQSAPLPGTVQDALDLLDAIHGDAAIQYHAYASLHDAISRIELHSAPLVADSREAMIRAIRFPTKWNSSAGRGQREQWEPVEWVLDEEDAGEAVDHLLASGLVSLAADRDRAVAERARAEEADRCVIRGGLGHSTPHRESEARND